MEVNPPLFRTDYEDQDGELVQVTRNEIYGWLPVHRPTGQVTMDSFSRFSDHSDQYNAAELAPGWEWLRFTMVPSDEAQPSSKAALASYLVCYDFYAASSVHGGGHVIINMAGLTGENLERLQDEMTDYWLAANPKFRSVKLVWRSIMKLDTLYTAPTNE